MKKAIGLILWIVYGLTALIFLVYFILGKHPRPPVFYWIMLLVLLLGLLAYYVQYRNKKQP